MCYNQRNPDAIEDSSNKPSSRYYTRTSIGYFSQDDLTNISLRENLKNSIEFRKMTDKVIVYGGRGGLGIVIVDAFKV